MDIGTLIQACFLPSEKPGHVYRFVYKISAMHALENTRIVARTAIL